MRKLWFLLLLAMLPSLAMAQVDDERLKLEALQTNFEQFARKNPQERVYLHFDNTSYYKGEHIYYKAFVVDDATLKASDLSRILYVELVNPIGYPVETQKLMVRNGQANGSFHLKDTLNAGFYEVRAYTAWMLNFAPGNGHDWDAFTGILAKEFYGERFQHYLRGNAGIFSRVFPIYEKVEKGHYEQRSIPVLPKITAPVEAGTKDRLKIDFYPEGGNMVRDVSTRVAFQAHTTDGRTLNIEGTILRKGKEIGSFKTDYAGRGVFAVTTDESDENDDEWARGLKLKTNYEGKDYTFSLPKAHRRGVVLNVTRVGDGWKAVISRNDQTKGMQLGVNVTSRGRTFKSGIVDLRNEKSQQMTVSDNELQTGVNVFTLYNTEGKVVAQRLFFVNKHDMDGMRIKVEMPENNNMLTPNQQVEIGCQVVDKEGNPVKGRNRFAVAVTDKRFHDDTYADDNMLSYLLLSSEVKGFIPHPEYYFESDDQRHRAALDILLMVQGWTRYEFERMMDEGAKWEPLFAVERGLNFRGRLVDDHGTYDYALWKKVDKPLWVFNELTTPYNGNVDAEIKTDSLGFFMFNFSPFYGKGRMSLAVNKESAEKIGKAAAGVKGHNITVHTKGVPWHWIDKHIIPLNPYSPVARNYDYYETWALNDEVDKNIFRDGWMARKTRQDTIIFYNEKTKTYILSEVVKEKKRHWADISGRKPVAVIDVDDMMTYLSNIFGSINDFHYSENYLGMGLGDDFSLVGNDAQKGGWWNPGAERDGSVQNNFADDRFFADMMRFKIDEQKRKKESNDSMPAPTPSYLAKKANSQRIYNRLMGQSEYKFDQTYLAYYNFYKLFMLIGIYGTNYTMVDGDLLGPNSGFVAPGSYGYEENLPPGMKFFPHDINFKRMSLFADVADRSLIHRKWTHHDQLGHFDPKNAANFDKQLTSITDFETEEIFPNNQPAPIFYGFRINFQGLSEPDEFYQVDYSKEPLPEQGDYRRTIYWNPGVVTDVNGRATVTFYNNSFSQGVTVSAEGLGDNGFIIMEKQ